MGPALAAVFPRRLRDGQRRHLLAALRAHHLQDDQGVVSETVEDLPDAALEIGGR